MPRYTDNFHTHTNTEGAGLGGRVVLVQNKRCDGAVTNNEVL